MWALTGYFYITEKAGMSNPMLSRIKTLLS